MSLWLFSYVRNENMLKYEEKQDGTCIFRIKKELYPLKALYRAAYLFMDDYYIGMDCDEQDYVVIFSGKEKQADRDDIGRFQNELFSQSIKCIADQDTKQIRELIVARALYSAFIPEENMDQTENTETEDDYDLDEIAKAWYDE